jgi:hypothetical protein
VKLKAAYANEVKLKAAYASELLTGGFSNISEGTGFRSRRNTGSNCHNLITVISGY